jgi:hypothetical protein
MDYYACLPLGPCFTAPAPSNFSISQIKHMSTAATSKKRKRAQVEADNASSQANVSLVSSTLPVSQLGPVLGMSSPLHSHKFLHAIDQLHTLQ